MLRGAVYQAVSGGSSLVFWWNKAAPDRGRDSVTMLWNKHNSEKCLFFLCTGMPAFVPSPSFWGANTASVLLFCSHGAIPDSKIHSLTTPTGGTEYSELSFSRAQVRIKLLFTKHVLMFRLGRPSRVHCYPLCLLNVFVLASWYSLVAHTQFSHLYQMRNQLMKRHQRDHSWSHVCLCFYHAEQILEPISCIIATLPSYWIF